MLHRAAAVLLLVCAVAACDSATEPVVLADHYRATLVNGSELPVRNIDMFSNSAGSCALDFDMADLMFYATVRFDMYLQYTMRCTGQSNPTRSTTRLHGTFTRNGNDIDLQPEIQSIDAVQRARVVGRDVIVDIRRTNGTELQIRFAPNAAW